MERSSYKFGVVNLLIFTAVISAYLVMINLFSDYSTFHSLQLLMAKIVYLIQHAAGIDVVLQDVTLHYPGAFRLEVSLLCTGINEILFFSLVLLGFIGVSLKTKLKGYAVFFPIILGENLIRVLSIQPLASLLGEGAALSFHNFSFKYGQMIFLVIIVVLWFNYFAKEEFTRFVRNYKQAKQPGIAG